MSKLKPVEEMRHWEVNNEIMERRHDCGLNYNIGRWALKWLRLEQDAAFGPFDGEPVEVEESSKEADKLADALFLLGTSAARAYSLPEWSERVARKWGWSNMTDAHFYEDVVRPLKDKGLIQPLNTDHGWKWTIAREKPEEKDALHYTLKDDEFTLYRGDEVELKIVGISSARTVRLEQPTSLDIDTPTLKRCGSRFLVYCEEDGIEFPIDLRIHDLTFFRTPGQHTTKIDVYLRRKTEDSVFEIFAAKEDARIIQNAWLELDR